MPIAKINPTWRVVSGILAFGVIISGLVDYSSLFTLIYTALAVIFAVIAATSLRLYFLRVEKTIYLKVVLPVLLLVGGYGAYASVSGTASKVAVMAVTGLSLFILIKFIGLEKTPDFIEDSITIFTAFLLSISVWGMKFFFAPPWWLVSLVFLSFFFLLFWQNFIKYFQSFNRAFIYAMSMCVIMVQVVWALQFWPIYFVPFAIITTAIFYLIFVFSGLYFQNKMSARAAVFQSILIGLVLLLSLATSQWTSRLN